MWVLFDVATKGAGALASASWWSDSQRGVMPTTAAVGAAHAMVGTFVQASITSLISIPIGVFTAVYLVEYADTGRLEKASKWSMYAFRICASLMIAGIKNSFSPTLYPRIS